MSNPHWIAPIYQEETGQDYLGLRLVQEHMVDFLLPGIITITPRARYYAFYAWLLVEYAQEHPAGWSFNRFIKRREQIFGLANIAHDSSVVGLAGYYKFLAHWQSYRDAPEVPLTVHDYLQANRGGYDAYAGVMRTLGLVAEHENQRGWEVTLPGQELAAAFAQAIAGTRYYRGRRAYDEAESIETAVLQEYGAVCSLNLLAQHPDHLPTLERLFAFKTPFAPDSRQPESERLGNMRGTLGLLLDMQTQADQPLNDDLFRRHVANASCADYAVYRSADVLRPIADQWQMYQWRDSYSYGLYALWTYFLHWLKGVEKGTFAAFVKHFTAVLSPTAVATTLTVPLPEHDISQLPLQQHLADLLDATGLPPGSWRDRCRAFAAHSQTPLNPQTLFERLTTLKPAAPEATYLSHSWLLLAALYLRLSGVPQDTADWHWAEEGDMRRRSLALFVAGMDQRRESGASVQETWQWLFRDYVIAQHTLTSLDKWRQRRANTFHFRYEDGWFEYVRDGRADLSASRIRQAIDMLHDLALFDTDPETNKPFLTDLGQQTLQRILESADD